LRIASLFTRFYCLQFNPLEEPMYKKNIITLATLTGLFFSLNVNAQDVSIDGYQQGLKANVYNMAGTPANALSPQSSIPSRSFVDDVPPFSFSPFKRQSEFSDGSGTHDTAKGWSGFIRTNTAGAHMFVLKANGLSENSRCLATIEIDGKVNTKTTFNHSTVESNKFRAFLNRGMRPINIWLNCSEGQDSNSSQEKSAVTLELHRSLPGRNTSLIAIQADDFYSKIPVNNF
jgi:hypothetical protein